MLNNLLLISIRQNHYSKTISMVYSTFTSKQQATVAPSANALENVKSIEEMPGPKRLPIIGCLLEDKRFGGSMDFGNIRDMCSILNEKYGSHVYLKIANFHQVYIFDPDDIRKMFQSTNNMPMRVRLIPWDKYSEYRNRPVTLANSNGERWRKLRSASNPIAARQQTLKQFLPEQNKVVDEFIEIIEEERTKSGEAKAITIESFDRRLKNLALELVSTITFLKRMKCIREDERDPIITKVVDSINELFFTTSRLYMNFLPYGPYMPTKMWRRLVSASDTAYNSIAVFVKEAHEHLKAQNEEYKSDLKTKTILEQYLLTMDKYELTMDDVVALVSDFLLGGIDTTSIVMHYLLYEVGTNPDIQQQLYEEIKANYKNGVLTEENLENMSLLKSAVKETLRVHPIVSGVPRILGEDTVLGGYRIPKGTTVMAGFVQATKSDKYFRDPQKFDPKRWLRSEKEKVAIHPYSFLPFGTGARQCIGRRIAEQEIYLFAAKLIYNYEIEYVGEKFDYITQLLTIPDKPLNIKLTKRGN